MLSVEHVKKLLNDDTFSNKEIEEIRDGFRDLAEIIFEKWQKEKKPKEKVCPQKYTLSKKENIV
ncbi:hypothetical protein KAU40_00545 [Candidatus Parcubacteria bacterium]|nr:hypothetical protein [Candidatus Parcubacteria bacterium]